MLAIVTLASATSFLATVLLLHVGVAQMWIRYLVAACLGYGLFLFALRSWLHLRPGRRREGIDGELPSGFSGSDSSESIRDASPDFDAGREFDPGGGHFGGGGASGQYEASSSDPLPSLDIDLGGSDEVASVFGIVALIVAVVATVAAVVACGWIVWNAPWFLGEMIVDLALARGLYRHMRGAYDPYWLKTAVRHTFRPFLGVLVLLMGAAVAMQIAVPTARTMGEFARHALHLQL